MGKLELNRHRHFYISEAGVDVLTDVHIVLLANSISKRSMLRTLGVVGLGLGAPQCDAHMNNHPDINDAAYHVLTDWRHTQENDAAAYTRMKRALDVANLQKLKKIL